MAKAGARLISEVAQMVRDQERRRKQPPTEATEAEPGAMPLRKGIGPTDEQMARFSFKRENVNDGTKLKGRAYRREPWFLTLFRRGEIDADQLAALKYYRDAHESADRSETRCALNRELGGGPSDATALRLMMARETRDDCEGAIPPFLLDTLRAVAIHDRDYSDIARERYGDRRAKEVPDGKVMPITVLRPPSSRQRKRIATEFKTAAYALHTFVAPRIQTA